MLAKLEWENDPFTWAYERFDSTSMPINFADPAVQNIIQGLIANGLYSFISRLGYSGKRILIDEEIKEEPDLQRILERGNKIVREFNDLDPTASDKISLFLSSPEVDMVIRQIYSISPQVSQIRAGTSLITTISSPTLAIKSCLPSRILPAQWQQSWALGLIRQPQFKIRKYESMAPSNSEWPTLLLGPVSTFRLAGYS